MGALLLIIGAVLFIALALWLAWRASHFSANILGKLILAGIVLFFFYWALFGKSILANREFERICAREAGFKLHKSVELPSRYYDKHGNVDFHSSKKLGISSEVAERYVGRYESMEVSKEYSINKEITTYQDFVTGELLGVLTTFRKQPSAWPPVPGHVGAPSCPQTSGNDFFKSVEKQLFSRLNDQ